MSKNKMVRNAFFAISCLLTCAGFSRAESCSSKGQVQYKANGGCGTSERTCCPNRQWSEWDGECSNQDDCTNIGYWWDGSAESCPWKCESGYHKPRNYTGKLISKTERGCKYSVSDAEDYFYGKYSPALWRNNRAKCNFLNEAYSGSYSYDLACTKALENDSSSSAQTIACPHVYYYENCTIDGNNVQLDYEWAEMNYSCSPGEYRDICVRD